MSFTDVDLLKAILDELRILRRLLQRQQFSETISALETEVASLSVVEGEK